MCSVQTSAAGGLPCNNVRLRCSGTYKIPTANDIPMDFRVTLLKDAPCHRTPLAHSSKAIGEPPFFLGASVFFALNMTTVRWLARHETEAAILFHQNLGVALICGATLPFLWVTPTPMEWLGIAAMAVTMTGGQILTVKAFRIAPVGVVAPLEYAELIGASLIGYFVWREIPADHVWAGAGIIIASGLYMIWRETGKRAG